MKNFGYVRIVGTFGFEETGTSTVAFSSENSSCVLCLNYENEFNMVNR